MSLNQSIGLLPRTSIITIRRLKSVGIKTFWDLLNYFPYRYDNYSLVSSIATLQPGEIVTIRGQIIDARFEISKKGTKIQKFQLKDDSGIIDLIWYNQPYLLRIIRPGIYLSLAGEVKKFGYKPHFEPSTYELIKSLTQETIHTGRLIPIYSEKRGLSSKIIREKIFNLITNYFNIKDIKLKEWLPDKIKNYNNLLDEALAYKNIHFPQDITLANKARRRLAFDELFVINLSALLAKQRWTNISSTHIFTVNRALVDDFIFKLPFTLTADQNKVISEIITDLKKDTPMNRFLQGDVGSGKTIIATIACYISFLNGFKSLFMAPTEILTSQHYKTITDLFKKKFIKQPKILLITSSIKPKKTDLIESDIIIGTHSLIQKNIEFEKVGLIVIDEQHRFGVAQRALLKQKAQSLKQGFSPHLLTMTATPIPRTVALTLYGDLEMSIIKEMPKGRLPIKTYLVPKEKRNSSYQWIKENICKNKIQVFVICPLIEESEVETMKSVKAALKEYDFLKNEVFPSFNVGLIHGKLKSPEKNKIMADFKNRRFDILVATSLVEVGIDIPNASIMLIEAAERYGLAQLHQLRGRIGRGNKQSYCFLFSDNQTPSSLSRLSFFCKTLSGIELSEYDLHKRGPGELFGTKQHGYMNLKIASFSDFELINETRNAAKYFILKHDIKNYLYINKKIDQYNLTQVDDN